MYPKKNYGCIKENPLNKELLPFSCYVITHTVDYTCTGPLENICGSRSLPYIYGQLDLSVHRETKIYPTIKPNMVGVLFLSKNNLVCDEVLYDIQYRVKHKVDLYAWVVYEKKSTIVHMLELFKTLDPDS